MLDRLTAIGVAYVRVGLEHPAHMEVAFRDDLVDADNPELQLIGQQAFGVLEKVIAEMAQTANPSLDVRTASHRCWSAMQGLIELHPKITLLDAYDARPPASTEDLVARFTELMLTGLLNEQPR